MRSMKENLNRIRTVTDNLEYKEAENHSSGYCSTLDAMTEFEKALRKDGYRAGWNDRADHDRELIEDAARQSRDFEDFISNLREKFRKTEESILL